MESGPRKPEGQVISEYAMPYRMVRYALFGVLGGLMLTLFFAIPGKQVSQVDGLTLSLMVLFPVLGLVTDAFLQTRYKFTVDTSAPHWEEKFLQEDQAGTILRFVVSEGLTIAAIVLTFTLQTGGLFFLAAGATSAILMVRHVLPTARLFQRVEDEVNKLNPGNPKPIAVYLSGKPAGSGGEPLAS